ncbi:MAG TPA: ATP-binding protein [Bacteroidales bacterium]|nr:ATP-binding protein [Bacteroidales bacterium]
MKFVQSEQNVRNGYLAAFLLLLLIYAVVFFSTIRMNGNFKKVEHSYNVIWSLEQLSSSIKDAESITSGYVFLSNPRFLESFQAIKKQSDSLVFHLQVHTAQSQMGNAGKLRDLVNREFAFLQQLIDSRKRGIIDSVQMTHIGAPEFQSSAKIFALIDLMARTERLSFNQDTYNLYSMPFTFIITNLVGLLISLILGFYAYRTYNKENREKRRYRQELEDGIKQLQETNKQLDDLRSIEKFAVSGRITRTIAHEVRNPLTNISLACEQLKITDEDDAQLIGIIKRNTQRITDLTSEVLNSTKFTELNIKKVFVHSVIEDTLKLAMDRINLNEIQIIKNFAPPKEVEIDPDKIKIAFLNITINAIEAMEPHKGVLEIQTANQADHCLITIRDNGAGMSKEAVSKIFEPFFTTKVSGNGLGLTNTQNIILNHKGRINVESTVGKGTTFLIRLNYEYTGEPNENSLISLN